MENFGTALNLFHDYNKSYSTLEIMQIDISSKNLPHFSGLSFSNWFYFSSLRDVARPDER